MNPNTEPKSQGRNCFLSYIGLESDKTCIQIPNLFLIDNVSLGKLHNLFTFSAYLKIDIIIPQSIGDIGLIERTFSVQFSRSALSDSLRPYEVQHVRPPCPSPAPEVHPNPFPLCQWCHPNISSSLIPFFSQHQGLFKWVSSLHQLAKVLEFRLQHPSLQRIPRTYLL